MMSSIKHRSDEQNNFRTETPKQIAVRKFVQSIVKCAEILLHNRFFVEETVNIRVSFKSLLPRKRQTEIDYY